MKYGKKREEKSTFAANAFVRSKGKKLKIKKKPERQSHRKEEGEEESKREELK